MQEKKQKKIKALGIPAKFQASNLYKYTRPNFLALGRGPFLALMQEKKQKKIKASGMPAKFQASDLYECTRPNFPALGRGLEFLLLLFFSQGKKRRSHWKDFSDLMIFFSSLDRRKEAKEDQGIRDAGQFCPGTCLEILRRPISGLTHGRKHRAADQTGLPLLLFSYMRSDQ